MVLATLCAAVWGPFFTGQTIGHAIMSAVLMAWAFSIKEESKLRWLQSITCGILCGIYAVEIVLSLANADLSMLVTELFFLAGLGWASLSLLSGKSIG